MVIHIVNFLKILKIYLIHFIVLFHSHHSRLHELFCIHSYQHLITHFWLTSLLFFYQYLWRHEGKRIFFLSLLILITSYLLFHLCFRFLTSCYTYCQKQNIKITGVWHDVWPFAMWSTIIILEVLKKAVNRFLIYC